MNHLLNWWYESDQETSIVLLYWDDKANKIFRTAKDIIECVKNGI